jgi:hypothetical protein
LGIETRKLNGETLKMTGDSLIISAEGISKIKISKMHKEKSINLKGYHIAICRGQEKLNSSPSKFLKIHGFNLYHFRLKILKINLC